MPKVINAELNYANEGIRFESSVNGHTITMDGSISGEEVDTKGASPMEIMLQSVAGCSGMDVVSILQKKRKTINDLKIEITGEKRDEHPSIYTKAHLKYTLTSPDAEMKDLNRSIELSQDKYCGASEMFKLAGCEVTWEASLINE